MNTPPDKLSQPFPKAGPTLFQVHPKELSVAALPIWRTEYSLFVLIVVLYVFPGLIGHDPWKQDETYITEIVRHMLDSGDWTVPRMAGEPFMEKPPLFYWVAAICAAIFSPFLPLHDGARLATGLFLSGTCAAVAWVGHHWWGRHHGRISLVTLLSCLGMVLHAHFMLTDVAMTTGFAIAICGLALGQDKWAQGGMLLGTGVGIGFLSKGLLAPAVIGACALLLPLLFRRWRHQSYAYSLAIAFVAASPWLLIWPIALFRRSPQLFMEWFWLNNIGRFVGFSVPQLGASHSDRFWLMTLPWFTFPALPLAILSIWRRRGTAVTETPVQISVVLFGTLLTVLWASASARDNYALPLLLPIALLAAPAVGKLPDLLDKCWKWMALAFFGSFATFLWATWAWMMVHGTPPHLPLIADYLPQDFTPKFAAYTFVTALALTVAPLFLARYLLSFAGTGLAAWFAGLTTGWALVSSLWLPWIDSAKSYRSVFDAVKTALPAGYNCVAEAGMGESELSMLSYFQGITAVRIESGRAAHCGALLVNGAADTPPGNIDVGRWVLTWQGARPGDRHERFWLYIQRNAAKKKVKFS
jgi:4-amino-4-deoxy-L-arabinose transferase-like glycosyltransferase